ncbi:MAG: hypothetical protein V1932_05685 [Chloroflexota bacterium]
MEWQVIVALVLAIPILLIPVALIWYINIGGIMLAVKEARKRRVAQEKETREIVTATREK